MFARTARLLLRPGWPEDAPALHSAIADEAVARHLAGLPWPCAMADAEALLAREHAPDAPRCLIFLRGEGAPRLVGGIGMGSGGIGSPPGGRELGMWIARPWRGRGIATEAGRAMIAFARDTLRLERLRAGHFVDSPASARLLARLGFCPTGATRPRFSPARGAAAPWREYELGLAAGAAASRADCSLAA